MFLRTRNYRTENSGRKDVKKKTWKINFKKNKREAKFTRILTRNQTQVRLDVSWFPPTKGLRSRRKNLYLSCTIMKCTTNTGNVNSTVMFNFLHFFPLCNYCRSRFWHQRYPVELLWEKAWFLEQQNSVVGLLDPV